MKFVDIFSNYIRFIKKQGSTSWLILVYPIILILVVGIGLKIGTTEKITVAVHGDDPVLDIISDNENLAVVNAYSEEDIEYLVKSKRAIMGISISTGGSRKTINIYLDPTKQAVTSNLLLLVDKAVNEEKYKSGASLSIIQSRLAPSLIEMKVKRNEISTFLQEIQEMEDNISATKQDLIEARSKLSGYRDDLISYKSNLSKMDYYQQKLSNYDSSLYSLSYTLSQKESERNTLSNKMSSSITKMNNYMYKIDNTRNQVSYAKAYTDPSSYTYQYLNQIDSELVSLKSDLISTRADLITTRNELNAIDFYSMQTTISSLRSDISTTKGELASFKSSTESKIDFMILDIDESDKKIASAISGLESFEARLKNIERKVSETQSLLDKIITPLEEFLGKKPEELLPPHINDVSVFPEQEWMDMFFPSIIGIDMLLASLLLPMIMKVRMREQGVELRMFRSKAGTASVIVGETAANYLVSLLQLILIFIFGIVLFGVKVSNPFGFAVVLVTVPIVFTSLGVLLSQIIRRSSTAFLLSLLISIPMIFISGTIIPLEFLNPVIATVGSIAPLYRVIEFVEMMFFRNPGLLDVLGNYFYLVAFTGVNIVLAMIVYYLKR